MEYWNGVGDQVCQIPLIYLQSQSQAFFPWGSNSDNMNQNRSSLVLAAGPVSIHRDPEKSKHVMDESEAPCLCLFPSFLSELACVVMESCWVSLSRP